MWCTKWDSDIIRKTRFFSLHWPKRSSLYLRWLRCPRITKCIRLKPNMLRKAYKKTVHQSSCCSLSDDQKIQNCTLHGTHILLKCFVFFIHIQYTYTEPMHIKADVQAFSVIPTLFAIFLRQQWHSLYKNTILVLSTLSVYQVCLYPRNTAVFFMCFGSRSNSQTDQETRGRIWPKGRIRRW
jgi:hypothetical protein